MSKKLFAACLVIAAFVVVPSFASANPILTEPTGTPVAPGKKVEGTLTENSTLVTSTGTLTCTTGTLTGEIVSNETSTGTKANLQTASFGGTGPVVNGEGECTGSNFFTPNTTITPNVSHAAPWCLQAPEAADNFTVRGGSCSGAAAAITFSLDVTGVGTCKYSKATAINGTVVTHGAGANENTLRIASVPFLLAEGPGLCPGEGKLTMRMSLETDDETHAQVFISP